MTTVGKGGNAGAAGGSLIYLSEVFPTRIRGRAVAISSLAVWTADAILNQPMCSPPFSFPSSILSGR
jgi:hypothetical protein